MKRIFFYLLLALVFSGCAGYKLEKTVWGTLTPTERDGQRASVVTSLFFKSSEDVDVYKAVVDDKKTIVPSFKYAECKYKVTGNPKKKAEIEITGTDIQSKYIDLKGNQTKNEMVLVSQDTVCYIYGKLDNVKLP